MWCSAQPCRSDLLYSIKIHMGISPSPHPKAITQRSKSSTSPVGRGKSKGKERREKHYLFIQETEFGSNVAFQMFLSLSLNPNHRSQDEKAFEDNRIESEAPGQVRHLLFLFVSQETSVLKK